MANNILGSTQNVQYVEIGEKHEGQRIDNFLIAVLKGVPKSRIYRMLRKGEVRVNKKRCKATVRLAMNDLVRIPPVRMSIQTDKVFVPERLRRSLVDDILYEDASLLIINKPSGFPVHGGSGVRSGIIEGLREIRPDHRFLELVHRLDKDTSGCLIVAKKRSALRKLHEYFRGDGVSKTYLALLVGVWQQKKQWVDVPLLKNISKGGERMVVVSPQGKQAETAFRRLGVYKTATLVEARPKTGRTHQIRVHAKWLGHPIVGDERYGDTESVNAFKANGFDRLMLHAHQLTFKHPETEQPFTVTAELPTKITTLLTRL
ncbi:MAG TPA: 23S rRNA pseudouridine(955/2504/2580) synthase RluC [Methylococcaceae bacterium]|jgi:23S rRNA pseudouridine955/2504/2580 synthase|nr:23S rRNA pseudouridine(955/2504/2580) synthase RluC [Methylococcaceae bacterium]HIB62014.1 23S rRNA pseudouridine(955/2504/2580) synthase RluC [Methylococcaceae bacterium]HIN69272.1 23S rRNA pseudouridine(955/2504/2580) synthase RluC [Methylococcales bacterium]